MDLATSPSQSHTHKGGLFSTLQTSEKNYCLAAYTKNHSITETCTISRNLIQIFYRKAKINLTYTRNEAANLIKECMRNLVVEDDHQQGEAITAAGHMSHLSTNTDGAERIARHSRKQRLRFKHWKEDIEVLSAHYLVV